jgi:hypothetical protein
MRKILIGLTFLAAIISGCSSNQSKPAEKSNAEKPSAAKAETPKESERLTGREVFQKLYIAARNWSPDAQPLKMESNPRKDDKRDGRASVWSGSFASSQRGQIRSFLWSGATGEGAPEPGITPGGQDTFNAANASTQPFDPSYLKADTDKALAEADKHAPASAKKDKDSPVKFHLYNETTKQRLLWRVIYGQSESNAKAVVDVSARDGGFVKIER